MATERPPCREVERGRVGREGGREGRRETERGEGREERGGEEKGREGRRQRRERGRERGGRERGSLTVVDRLLLEWNMSTEAAAGAVSLKSIAAVEPFGW